MTVDLIAVISHPIIPSLSVCFWLGDIRHLRVDIEKCVCTSTLLSPQSLSKRHVHKSEPNNMVQHASSTVHSPGLKTENVDVGPEG